MRRGALKCQRRMFTSPQFRSILLLPLLLALVAIPTAAVADAAMERVDVFQAGEGGYAHYRIPGVVVTPGGAVLAYCEARASLGGDWGKTDLLFRRSTD